MHKTTKRISKIPNAIDQLMIFEKEKTEAGIYSPKFVYEKDPIATHFSD